MKVPKDPNLYLTVFVGIGVAVVLAFWLLTPVYTPHLEHEPEPATVKPEQALGQVDAMLAAAEKTLVEMDAEKDGDIVELKDKPIKTSPDQENLTPVKVVPSALAGAGHGIAGHEHVPEESSHSPHAAGGNHAH